ncbi:hypothetical protein AB0A98_37350 [Streptomyces chrestomyceticus]|uniref:hypothetical protein n=1 Tax=Streptomyces chrestomyceticus TaxID=68185 RepID=UPI0033F45F51
MAEQLSVDEVIRHLTTKDGNTFLTDAARRAQKRAGVAQVVTALLGDNDLADEAVTAEHLCNALWRPAGVAAQEDGLPRTGPAGDSGV